MTGIAYTSPISCLRHMEVIQGEVTALSPPSLQVRSHGARAMGLIGRGGPAPRRRARSLEAGLLLLRLRAAHARTRPHAGKWGGGGSPSLPPLCRAMRACFAGGRPHADGRRRRASPSRAPRSAWAYMQLRTREPAQAGLACGLPRRGLAARGVPARARRASSVGVPTSRELRLRRRRLLARRCARLAFGYWRPRALALAR